MGNYSDIIADAAGRYNIPPELIDAVIKTESSYRPYAVSSKGAIGLMQLMPATARELGVRNPFNPRENIEGGASFLSQLYNRFGNWRDALSYYNAGNRLELGRGYADKIIGMLPGLPNITGSAMGETGATALGGIKKWWNDRVETNRDRLTKKEGETGVSVRVALYGLAALLIILGVWKLIK